jgi:arsenate reductase
MAKTILESMDSTHRVISAGISPAEEINPLSIQVMNEMDLPMKLADLQAVTALNDEPVDYLITLSESTKEEFRDLPFPYKNKLHLSFNNPDKPSHRYESQLDAYRHLRDEIRTELDYFYYRILKEKAAN